MGPDAPQNQPVTAPRRSWWSRNWKWFVPTGCLTILALIVAFVAAIVLLVFGAMKSSDAYKTAVSRARANSAVVAALGSPLHEGMFVSGDVNVNGGTGSANLSIPISGPKGKGTIYAEGTKSAGAWSYKKMVVEIEQSRQRINLLDQAADDETDEDEQ